MRGAQDADGHAPERARRRPLARPNRARALADDVAKRAPERAEAFPAGVKGDLGDRKIGVAEQCGRSLDAPSEQVAVRRDAERSLKRSREVRFGHAAHTCEPAHRPLLVACAIHPVLRTQQATQQLGVLIHELGLMRIIVRSA